jgi:hypothetical protein
VQGILATDGVQLSQASAYVDGATINDNNFCSQNAVKYFRNGYMRVTAVMMIARARTKANSFKYTI